MKLVLALPGGETLSAALASRLGCGHATVHVHRFPDGEQLVRVDEAVEGHHVVLACSLEQPDAKLLPLLFTADVVRELGAASVGLVAPYLAYMRQDARFRPGEAITSVSFANLLSPKLDFLVTVEPHLHRTPSLSHIYRPATRAVSAAPAIAAWLRGVVPSPLLVGPDEESHQWVSRIADELGAPYAVLRKTRRGDFDVLVDGKPSQAPDGREAVLVDDIVSSGGTVLAACESLRSSGWPVNLCVCVHALYDEAAARRFEAQGLRVASCNTAAHPSNRVDINPALAEAVAGLGLD